MTAKPNVGPALAATRFSDAALKRVEGAFWVGLGGRGLAQDITKIDKVLLASRPFGKVGLAPLGDEFLGCHTCCGPLWAKMCE